MYISKPYKGYIYVAEPLPNRFFYRWSRVPVEPTRGFTQVYPRNVPSVIKEQAYNLFEGDRLRAAPND
jgi:hypothetical protein